MAGGRAVTVIGGAVALVTGATSGIGRALVPRLTSLGCLVVATGRNEPDLLQVAAETGARTVVADLAEMREVHRLGEEALAVHGRIDILANVAGAGWAGPFAEMPEAEAGRLIRVNLEAPVLLTRLLLPGMIDRGRGHIVNVASIVGAVGVPGEVVYGATKSGLLAFSESLRAEIEGSPVVVTSVLPGVVDTRFFERRGLPYERTWPRPLRPGRVAGAISAAIEKDRTELYVPRWLRFPARLHGTLPGLYRRLARRFG